MADDNKVTIELDLDTGQFTQSIGGVVQGLKAAGEAGESSFSSMGAKAIEFNQILELLEKGFEIIKEVFVETIGESIKASMNQEQALTSLNLALANSGYYSKSASDGMLEMANSLAETTNFSKDLILSLEAQAINMTKSEDAAKKMTQAAIALSAATGKDVHTSLQTLSLSMEGITRGLDKLVPGMKNLTEEQLRAGGAADMIISKFGGTAQLQTETFSGHVTGLKKAFEELHVAIGDAITQSPIVNRAIEGMTTLLKEAMKVVTDWASGGGFERILKSLIALSDGIVTYFVKPLEMVYNIGKLLFDSLVLGTNVFIAALADVGGDMVKFITIPMEVVMKGVAEVVGVFSKDIAEKIKSAVNSVAEGVRGTISTIQESTKAVVQDGVRAVNEDMHKMFDFSVSDKLSGKIQEIKTFFDGAKAPIKDFSSSVKGALSGPEAIGVGEGFSRILGGMKTAALDFAKSGAQNFEKLGKQMFQSIGQAAGSAFSAFGKALATGQNALQAFANSLLSSLGQASVQMGTNFMLQGAAYLWAGMPNGPSLIAAGAALATFGGVLAGLGGGGGGATADTSSAGGGGGGATGPATSAAGGSTSMDQSQNKAPSKQATIVVNGDFLNSRETANHLQEIIRQNSDITDYSITAQGRSYA